MKVVIMELTWKQYNLVVSKGSQGQKLFAEVVVLNKQQFFYQVTIACF